MPFVPHTDEDIKLMLQAIGVDSIEALFAEIPQNLRIPTPIEIPEALNEMAVTRLMTERAQQDKVHLNFIGAGAYEHHIPAAVWDIASRGEWMTSYTPYQAEASQGSLQLLYEYQSMMAQLMQLEVSNASLYEGASSLAEAILMAIRCTESDKPQRILMPKTVHPFYRQVVTSIVSPQKIDIIELPFCKNRGLTLVDSLKEFENQGITALVIPMPNFFGVLEEVDELTHWAEKQGCLVVALVNPMAMSWLKPPGAWGQYGADIACGEGQPLGIPLASGGPYFGFLCCKKKYIRQLPGRLIGKTTDVHGKTGFTLTLQAREQHIRRGKATSNICTNQGLLVTAATLYMSLLGTEGLTRIAMQCHENTSRLCEALTDLPGISLLFKSPFFHEIALKLPVPAESMIKKLSALGIEAGFNLKPYYPELGDALLLCATETKAEADIIHFTKAFEERLHKEISVC